MTFSSDERIEYLAQGRQRVMDEIFNMGMIKAYPEFIRADRATEPSSTFSTLMSESGMVSDFSRIIENRDWLALSEKYKQTLRILLRRFLSSNLSDRLYIYDNEDSARYSGHLYAFPRDMTFIDMRFQVGLVFSPLLSSFGSSSSNRFKFEIFGNFISRTVEITKKIERDLESDLLTDTSYILAFIFKDVQNIFQGILTDMVNLVIVKAPSLKKHENELADAYYNTLLNNMIVDSLPSPYRERSIYELQEKSPDLLTMNLLNQSNLDYKRMRTKNITSFIGSDMIDCVLKRDHHFDNYDYIKDEGTYSRREVLFLTRTGIIEIEGMDRIRFEYAADRFYHRADHISIRSGSRVPNSDNGVYGTLYHRMESYGLLNGIGMEAIENLRDAGIPVPSTHRVPDIREVILVRGIPFAHDGGSTSNEVDWTRALVRDLDKLEEVNPQGLTTTNPILVTSDFDRPSDSIKPDPLPFTVEAGLGDVDD